MPNRCHRHSAGSSYSGPAAYADIRQLGDDAGDKALVPILSRSNNTGEASSIVFSYVLVLLIKGSNSFFCLAKMMVGDPLAANALEQQEQRAQCLRFCMTMFLLFSTFFLIRVQQDSYSHNYERRRRKVGELLCTRPKP